MVQSNDNLRRILLDFFGLPESTPEEELAQDSIAAWDSLGMVQLIAELQGAFAVEFDLNEIEALRSYGEIRAALERKGVPLAAN